MAYIDEGSDLNVIKNIGLSKYRKKYTCIKPFVYGRFAGTPTIYYFGVTNTYQVIYQNEIHYMNTHPYIQL